MAEQTCKSRHSQDILPKHRLPLLPILAGGKDVVQGCEDELFADYKGKRYAALHFIQLGSWLLPLRYIQKWRYDGDRLLQQDYLNLRKVPEFGLFDELQRCYLVT